MVKIQEFLKLIILLAMIGGSAYWGWDRYFNKQEHQANITTEVYQWRDENGVLQFSDRIIGKAENVSTKTIVTANSPINKVLMYSKKLQAKFLRNDRANQRSSSYSDGSSKGRFGSKTEKTNSSSNGTSKKCDSARENRDSGGTLGDFGVRHSC